MEKSLKIQILESIGNVYSQAENSKLTPVFFDKANPDLRLLATYFNTSESQALFIAVVFSMNYNDGAINLKDLIKFFDCVPSKILEFSDDLTSLYTKGIFSRPQKHFLTDMCLGFGNEEFAINKKIPEAILQNKPMPVTEPAMPAEMDIVTLLERIYHLGKERDEDKITTDELLVQTEEFITENKHLPLIKKISDYNYETEDVHLYLYLIWKTLSGNETSYVGRALEGIFDYAPERIRYMEGMINGTNRLIKDDLVEIVEAYFFNDTEMKLTDKSLDTLNECGIRLFVHKKKNGNIIQPVTIPVQQLFYSDDEMQQLSLLKNLLNESNLATAQERLISKGLPKGITVLLHGAPGTGKTETVKQLARETGREIMKVEISEAKSMWFGESERLIKRIFTDYAAYAKNCSVMPVLLFNEADAIFSRRRDVDSSSTSQVQNTIQNILLEELENFQGILIATTNLTNNMDAAFERRFLFKVKFRKPGLAQKMQIWKWKLPDLTDDDCRFLAMQFEFSGGQIDNIVRKYEINMIIREDKDDLNRILDFCREETINQNRIPVGFNRTK